MCICKISNEGCLVKVVDYCTVPASTQYYTTINAASENLLSLSGSGNKTISKAKAPQADFLQIYNNWSMSCNMIDPDQMSGLNPITPEDEEGKTFHSFQDVVLNESPKKLSTVKVYVDNISGALCFYKLTDINLSDPLTINDFIMGNELKGLPVSDNEFDTKEGKTIDICGGAAGRIVGLADADLAAEITAQLAAITAKHAPGPGYEWALLGYQVSQHPAIGKKKVRCDLTDTDAQVLSAEQAYLEWSAANGGNGTFITPGEGPFEVVKELGVPDACGCLDDRTCLLAAADFGTELTIGANTAIRFCPLFVCSVV